MDRIGYHIRRFACASRDKLIEIKWRISEHCQQTEKEHWVFDSLCQILWETSRSFDFFEGEHYSANESNRESSLRPCFLHFCGSRHIGLSEKNELESHQKHNNQLRGFRICAFARFLHSVRLECSTSAKTKKLETFHWKLKTQKEFDEK